MRTREAPRTGFHRFHSSTPDREGTVTTNQRSDRVRLLRLAGRLIETGNYWFQYHVRRLGEDPADLARRLYSFAAELEAAEPMIDGRTDD